MSNYKHIKSNTSFVNIEALIKKSIKNAANTVDGADLLLQIAAAVPNPDVAYAMILGTWQAPELLQVLNFEGVMYTFKSDNWLEDKIVYESRTDETLYFASIDDGVEFASTGVVPEMHSKLRFEEYVWPSLYCHIKLLSLTFSELEVLLVTA
jgi:hypothetical protein